MTSGSIERTRLSPADEEFSIHKYVKAILEVTLIAIRMPGRERDSATWARCINAKHEEIIHAVGFDEVILLDK